MLRSRLAFAPALAASAAFALVGLASCPAQAQFVVTNFQTIDPPFAATAPNPYNFVSGAYGISNSGAIVGYYTDTDDNPQTISYDSSLRGYTFQNGGFTSVSYSTQAGTFNNSTILNGINSSGVTIGDYEEYNAQGVLVSQTNFIRSGAGVFSTPSVTPTATGTVDGFVSINDAGLVATQYTDGDRTHAALYNTTSNTFMLLPDFVTGGNTYIRTVNNNGDFVGSYDNGLGGAVQAFIYRNGAYTNLSYNAPGATATRFNGINDAGLVSGRYEDSMGLSHGLLYNSNNGFFSSFDFPGATETFLILGSINNSNQIAGLYVGQDDTVHSFRATVTAAPEPSALVLLTTGGSLLGSTVMVRRRHRRSNRTSKM